MRLYTLDAPTSGWAMRLSDFHNPLEKPLPSLSVAPKISTTLWFSNLSNQNTCVWFLWYSILHIIKLTISQTGI